MTLQYDGVRPVVEGTLEGDTWTTTARNVWEGDTYYSPLVLRLLPSGGYNYLADGLGSTRQLMRHSDHAITDTYAYDAFGNTLASTGSTDNPYRYVGALGYRAGGGGLMQLGVRDYWPSMGRLGSRDPIGSVVPETGGYQYAYARSRPVLLTDPSGLISCEDRKDECLRRADNWHNACLAVAAMLAGAGLTGASICDKICAGVGLGTGLIGGVPCLPLCYGISAALALVGGPGGAAFCQWRDRVHGQRCLEEYDSCIKEQCPHGSSGRSRGGGRRTEPPIRLPIPV